MTALYLVASVALAKPFIYDDGEVRCVLLAGDAVGVHEEALVAWAPRGAPEPGEELEDCVPVVPKVVACPEGLGEVLPFAMAVVDFAAADGVSVSRMSGSWLHVRGEGDLAVILEDGPPVLLRLKPAPMVRPQVRPGTIVDLGFEPDYIGGTGEVVRIGTSVMVLRAGQVYVKREGEAPVASAVAPESGDPQMVLKPGKARTVSVDHEVQEAVVGDPLVAGAVVRGRRVKVMASAAGDTRI